MGKCIILCAGGFGGLLSPIAGGDYLIAADGGLRHAQRFGLTPDCVLGDFDSLGYTPAGSQVFPVEKDDTDAMLAVRRGLALGYRDFLLYGCMDGPRLDHTIAALQTLQFLTDRGAKGALVGLTDIATVVKNGALRFPDTARGIVSVFCLGESARGVTLENLYYPLENATLTPGFPLGVSNHFLPGKAARIAVRQGSLTVISPRDTGLAKFESEV